jgi:hypothetical protein
MIKKTAAYVNSLDDPAGFDSSISFASTERISSIMLHGQAMANSKAT